ncbi:MAG: hypothetical protein KKE11_06140 [Gammaproteobacteria bacterium]|nr:hypothetical protein [Gammaproteobacteria bacterium]
MQKICMGKMVFPWSKMVVDKRRGVKGNIIVFALSFLVFVPGLLSGCSKTSLFANNKYEAKQVQGNNLEKTYVICKKCVDYTNINKFKTNGWRK